MLTTVRLSISLAGCVAAKCIDSDDEEKDNEATHRSKLPRIETTSGTAVPAIRGPKAGDTYLVCTWFLQLGDSALQLGSVSDATRYSARSCLGIVDLKLVDGDSSNRYTFANPVCQDKLLAALNTSAEPQGPHETTAAAEARKQVAEESRAPAELDAAAPARKLIARAPKKRAATAARIS